MLPPAGPATACAGASAAGTTSPRSWAARARRAAERKAAAVDHHPSAEPRPIACTKSDEDGTIVCGGSAPGARAARYSCGHPRQAPHHDACRRPRVRPFASVARSNRRTSGRDDGEQRARRVARCLPTAAIGAVDDGRAGACPRSSNVGAHERRDRDAHARGVRCHRRHHRRPLEARTIGVADYRPEVVEHRDPVVAELLAPPPELEAALESRVLRARVDAEANPIPEHAAKPTALVRSPRPRRADR